MGHLYRHRRALSSTFFAAWRQLPCVSSGTVFRRRNSYFTSFYLTLRLDHSLGYMYIPSVRPCCGVQFGSLADHYFGKLQERSLYPSKAQRGRWPVGHLPREYCLCCLRTKCCCLSTPGEEHQEGKGQAHEDPRSRLGNDIRLHRA